MKKGGKTYKSYTMVKGGVDYRAALSGAAVHPGFALNLIPATHGYIFFLNPCD
jgi:hypothetical protein